MVVSIGCYPIGFERAFPGRLVRRPALLFRAMPSRKQPKERRDTAPAMIAVECTDSAGQNSRTVPRRWIRLAVVTSDDLTQVASAFRRGEIWAFRRAAEEFFGPMANFLAHLVGSVDTAQDLAQEAFFAAFRSHQTFREGAPLAPWIFRIARNLAYQELKRRGKHPSKASLEELTERDGYEPLSETPSPHDRLAEHQLEERLNRALARLKPDFRDAVILRLVQGYSGQEAAALLGIPLATVNTRVHRGIRQLRKSLRREGIDESDLLR